MTTLLAPDDLIWSAAAGSAPANAGMHLHLYPDLAPAHLPQEPSVGVAFVVAVAWPLAAAGLPQPRTRAVAWRLGAAAAGMPAGYLASRTVGLPLGSPQGWDDPDGVAYLLLEPADPAASLAAVAARATSSP